MKWLRRLLLLLLIMTAAIGGWMTGIYMVAPQYFTDPSICQAPSGTLPSKVPPVLNSIFTQASKLYGTAPAALPIVYNVENHGYRDPPPPYGKGASWRVSATHDLGGFQFQPGTWEIYKNSNPAHQPGDVNDLVDSAYAAAHMLADLGAKGDAYIGSLPNPQRGTLLWAFGAYNAGSHGDFTNPTTADYLKRAQAEYNETFAVDRDLNQSTSSSSTTELCPEMKRGGNSNPAGPSFEQPTSTSCPSGTSSGPAITTLGLANPKQGPKILLCRVGGITVNAKIASQWQWLIAKANSQGIKLSGGGFRTYAQQVHLRKLHCGTSNYAIYRMSARACTPDTAVPGTSEHEQAMAVDLNMTQRIYRFLKKYAHDAHLCFTVPSEWWHLARCRG